MHRAHAETEHKFYSAVMPPIDCPRCGVLRETYTVPLRLPCGTEYQSLCRECFRAVTGKEPEEQPPTQQIGYSRRGGDVGRRAQPVTPARFYLRLAVCLSTHPKAAYITPPMADTARTSLVEGQSCAHRRDEASRRRSQDVPKPSRTRSVGVTHSALRLRRDSDGPPRSVAPAGRRRH